MNLFDLSAKISLDSSNFNNGIEKAKGGMENLTSWTVAKGQLIADGIKAGATAVVNLGKKMNEQVHATAEFADNIDKMSQKMGLSAEKYQEWDFIMQHSGTSMESLKAGMKTLANAAENGNEAFERLGISQQQMASMSQEELFEATLSGLQNVTNETERTYLAGQLLGRGATELGALLNTSAEDTEAMRQQVHDLGGVMTGEAVKAGATFQDSLQNVQTAFGGLKNNLTADFLPSFSNIMDGVSALVTGDDNGFALIETGVEQAIAGVTEKLPKFLEIGTQIVTSIGTAIVENLPLMLETSFSVLSTIATGLTENIPTLVPAIVDVVSQMAVMLTEPDTLSSLIDGAIAIIMALADGIIESLPTLLEKMPVIIQNLTTALTENTPKLLNASWEIIKALVKGIVQNLPQIISSAGKIIKTLTKALLGAIPKIFNSMKDIGKNIVEGIWQGINDMITWIGNKIGNFASGLVDKVKNKLGIHSPSKVFAGIGSYMAEGLGQGWDKEFGSVSKDISNSLDFGEKTVSARYNIGGNGGYATQQNAKVSIGIDDSNAMGFARALLPLLKVAESEAF